MGWGLSWSWSHGSWIHNYLCNRCLSQLKLLVWILLVVRCTYYKFMFYGLSMICRVSGFLWVHRFPPSNWLLRYNWNIVEGVAKHYNHNTYKWVTNNWIIYEWVTNDWIVYEWVTNDWIIYKWVTNDWIIYKWVTNDWIIYKWVTNNWIIYEWVTNNWIIYEWVYFLYFKYIYTYFGVWFSWWGYIYECGIF
jgi:hypothetical protein